ncbi:MAG TPA: hypothetical protein VNJ50_08350, partial [Gelidibacter sp.]|nr:hypothetical protein [Gelidibacter sp.]
MSISKEIPSVPLLNFLKHSLEIVKNPLPFHHRSFLAKGNTFKLKIGFSTEIIFSRDASFAEYVLQKNHKNYAKTKIQTQDLAKYI